MNTLFSYGLNAQHCGADELESRLKTDLERLRQLLVRAEGGDSEPRKQIANTYRAMIARREELLDELGQSVLTEPVRLVG